MKVYSVFLLGVTLALLPSINGQCTLCADGTSPPNEDATLPVPGFGEVPCSTVDMLIGNTEISPEECTRAQAGGYLICGCPTVPDPSLDLPCAFCPDGELPTNLDQAVSLPDGSNFTCQDLVAFASTLDNSTASAFQCTTITNVVSADCGCDSAPTNSSESAAPSESPATNSSVSAAPSSSPITNSSASQPTAAPSLEPSAEETTMPVSPAPSPGEPVTPTSEPTLGRTALPSPAVNDPTLIPTTEMTLTTSNSHRIVGAHVVFVSALIGVTAALV